MDSPIQRILFGSPGTGKSYQIKNVIAPALDIQINSENYIPTVFHPEYTYGDFMGKLMPLSDENKKVSYKFYAGHFLKALGVAYKNLINSAIKFEKDKKEVLQKYKEEIGTSRIGDFNHEQQIELEHRYSLVRRNTQKVILVIDEINRGNSASIFGTVFQLLDRKGDGWSDYPVLLSDLESLTLLKEIGLIKELKEGSTDYFYKETPSSKKDTLDEKDWKKYLEYIISDLSTEDKFDLNSNFVKIPANLSIVGTMNTSDNSIYFMDSAFKRRWDWEFIEIEDENQRVLLTERRINLFGQDKGEWCSFVDKLNYFIRSNYKLIRKIEDKQLGYRFINNPTISESDIKNKLMFFIWDSVFSNNKKPLIDLLGIAESELVTFGQFTKKEQVENFVTQILNLNV
jgi:5-methylcytosine-specific restriction protein B